MRAWYTRGALPLAFAFCLCLSVVPAHAEEEAGTGGANPYPAGSEEALPAAETAAHADAVPDPLFDDEWVEEEEEVSDPLERGNRVVLGFNQRVDAVLWDPITTGYRFVLPEPARRAVVRFFANLNTPVYMVNALLQLRPLDALETGGAFLMNTTFGLVGLMDAASAVYWERHPADFGQTMAMVGVGHGPYLMIPIAGPTTVRDGLGFVADFFMHPATWFLPITTLIIMEGGEGFARREAVADKLAELEASSLDYYSVLRSAYVQARDQSVEEAREARLAAWGGADAVAHSAEPVASPALDVDPEAGLPGLAVGQP